MTHQLKPLSWNKLILLFAIPTLLNFIACRIVIPILNDLKLFPIEISYFLSVGLLVMMPMFFSAIFLSMKEIRSIKLSDVFKRMRIKRLTGVDIIYTIVGFIFLAFTSFLIAKIILPNFNIDASPFFFQNMPLDDNHLYILYAWPAFFFFNIFGEEFLWRGLIQPRQELLNKNYTWLVHGILWALWHLPMGINLILSALPILFILPAIVQIRKNTSIAIIIHFAFGAFGFLALALGMVK